jgi:hypothetical protein
MMAKVSWNMQKTDSGMVPERLPGMMGLPAAPFEAQIVASDPDIATRERQQVKYHL